MRWNLRRVTSSQRARFLLVGAYNTVFGYVVFILLYMAAQDALHYLVIATIAHFLSVSHSFLTQRHLVFHHQGPVLSAFLRFNVATATVLVFGLLAMTFLVERCNMTPIASQAIVVFLTTIGSYLLHRHFSFGRSIHHRQADPQLPKEASP